MQSWSVLLAGISILDVRRFQANCAHEGIEATIDLGKFLLGQRTRTLAGEHSSVLAAQHGLSPFLNLSFRLISARKKMHGCYLSKSVIDSRTIT
jgi:hypothetical protein